MPSRAPSPEQPNHSDPDPFGAVACLSFALFGPGGAASSPLCNKKDPLRRKESDDMEPSGFEPLTPCMPFRHLTKSNQFKSQVFVGF